MKEKIYYLTDDWQPTDKEDADIIKIVTHKNGYREEIFFEKESEKDTLKVWIALQERDNKCFNEMKRTKTDIIKFLEIENGHSPPGYWKYVAEVDIDLSDPFELLNRALSEGGKKDQSLGVHNLYKIKYEDGKVYLRKVRDEQ